MKSVAGTRMSCQLSIAKRSPSAIAAAVLQWAAVLAVWPGEAAGACPDATQDIATDRPSVTNSSSVAPAGSLQLENGLNWTSGPGQDHLLDGPNTRARLGLGGCTELLVDLPD